MISGFLLTYLLLVEREQTGRVSIRGFYIRRSLRIWPPYLLVVVLSYLLFPQEVPTGSAAVVGILLFSPQIVSVFSSLGVLGHFWSLGVEEWFYAAFPWMINRRFVWICAAVIFVRLAWAFAISPHFALYGDRYVNPWLILFQSMRFDCMAIGALGAYAYFHQHWTIRWFYRIQVPIYLLVVLFIFLKFDAVPVFDLISSLVFLGLILNVSTNPKSLLKLERPWLSTLGKMTYGVYVYHLLIVYSLSRLVAPNPAINAWMVLASVIITGVVAGVSYHILEQPILRLKHYERTRVPRQSPVA